MNGQSAFNLPHPLWSLRCAFGPSGPDSMRFGFCRPMKPEGMKTFNKGSLGSRIDEERSEARNVV
jgi:hypothetical protein